MGTGPRRGGRGGSGGQAEWEKRHTRSWCGDISMTMTTRGRGATAAEQACRVGAEQLAPVIHLCGLASSMLYLGRALLF